MTSEEEKKKQRDRVRKYRSDPEKRAKERLRDKLAQRLKRVVQRKERQQKKDARIERQIKLGNLNYGIPSSYQPFMSWEEYKKLWEQHGHKVRFEQYLEEKEKHRVKRDVEVASMPKTHKRIYNVPFLNEDCRKNRAMLLAIIPRDAFFIQNHCCCKACNAWRELNANYIIGLANFGCDIWEGTR